MSDTTGAPHTNGARSTVEWATEDDLRTGVKNTLERLGLTFAQLHEQARNSDFDSPKARMAWVAIGDLGHLAPQ